jgi:carboxyl-terminal processing protease
MFSCAGEEYARAVRESMTDFSREADALVIDFRDGWGGCNPDFVNLFNRAPAILAMTNRDGKRTTLDSQWRKRLVVLINAGSRSGKEVVSHSIKKQGLGKLVGERTAGAVLAGRSFSLSDGSLLYLAVQDIEVDGERLEGRGVAPDVAVAETLPFANGADPQLERAVDFASQDQSIPGK